MDSTTPAMKQYYELKAQCPDAILFFRMGDFYEMFDEDAHIAHKVLGISITTRNKNAETPTPLAGIPYHAKPKYLPQLVKAGYKVALAEQISDPKLKGIVKREIVRVVTPSTLDLEGEDFEDDSSTNYLVSIIEKENKYGISILDITSNKWKTGELQDIETLKSELYKLSPKEVVLEKKLFSNTEIKNILENKYALNIYYFESTKKPESKLLTHFGVATLEGFGISGKPLAISASAQLLEYFECNQKSDVSFLNTISYMSFGNFMNLDESTIKSLDLIYNFSTKSATLGTLFGVLNKTKTSSGTRILREEILKPLQDKQEIENRLHFVEAFYKNKPLLEKVRDQLKYVSNIDSILNRLALNRANPRDLVHLKRSLESIVSVFETIEKEGSEDLKKILK